MVLASPGSLVHYRPSGSREPLRPAVVITDDIAPADFLRHRPHGYWTLLLLMGEDLQLYASLDIEGRYRLTNYV
jgi:hypothetical protein